MAGLKDGDPVAYALAHARDRDAHAIAERIGVPIGKLRAWRKGSLDLSPWVVSEIARVLELDDQTLEQHYQRRRQRHAQDVGLQRALEEAA